MGVGWWGLLPVFERSQQELGSRSRQKLAKSEAEVDVGMGVAGAAVDFDQFTVAANSDTGKIGVFFQLVDDHILQFAAESFNC